MKSLPALMEQCGHSWPESTVSEIAHILSEQPPSESPYTRHPYRYPSLFFAPRSGPQPQFLFTFLNVFAPPDYLNLRLQKITGCKTAGKWRQSQPQSVCVCTAVGRVER